MKRIITEAEMSSIKNIEKGYNIVESFNRNNCVKPNTKLIIVGTLTPPNAAEYFYTARRDRIYGYLDEYFEAQNNGLKSTKEQLYDKNIAKEEKADIVTQIKNFLIDHNVAFLDVIKCAIRKENSCADADIKHF